MSLVLLELNERRQNIQLYIKSVSITGSKYSPSDELDSLPLTPPPPILSHPTLVDPDPYFLSLGHLWKAWQLRRRPRFLLRDQLQSKGRAGVVAGGGGAAVDMGLGGHAGERRMKKKGNVWSARLDKEHGGGRRRGVVCTAATRWGTFEGKEIASWFVRVEDSVWDRNTFEQRHGSWASGSWRSRARAQASACGRGRGWRATRDSDTGASYAHEPKEKGKKKRKKGNSEGVAARLYKYFLGLDNNSYKEKSFVTRQTGTGKLDMNRCDFCTPALGEQRTGSGPRDAGVS
eukprot:767298-Hanusia_phi.AAC.4